ncbi:MAG: PorV/PorQ family protein [candidate division KSB1 bacterium]|nr:PorV/PorQ family protein [candidate division KSB1 bacterium]MDZ7304686.1 PorV/PorQ family protein [candidate division KSB1 bacterium]MDZ7311672.1 PorV/PorQ family protein [candidate division KSB1 bacterium]
MKIKFFFMAMCFTAATVWAQNPNLGTAGAQFLQIGVGAKPAALAGAYVAMANDALALFWNPAGIANIENQSVHFSHTPWWNTVTLNSAAYALRMGSAGTLGVAVSVLAMDEMEVTTELEPDGTGQTFDAQNLMIGLTYARPLTDRFSAGITVKYVQERIWNETASGIAFDVGTQYRTGFRHLTIGMSLTNFGGDMRFDGRDLSYKFDTDPSLPRNRLAPAKLETETYPLPLHFQVGVAMELMRSGPLAWQLGLDVTHPNDNSERINFGTEVAVSNQIFLRGGYRYNYDDEDLTLGFGVALPFAQNQLAFDYAYSRYDLLPNVNRFSLSLAF